jgi:hypothetical protein
MVKWGKIASIVIVGCIAISGLALHDLHNLGDKLSWNAFDQIRGKGYLLGGSIVGMVVPPIGPLNFINAFAKHGYHFATKSLPDESEMDMFRDILTNDQFCNELKVFDTEIRESNKSWATKDIIHRVHFGSGSTAIFDDWAVLLAVSYDGDETQLSYFVWGMGIVPDERAPEFFGQQLGKLSFLFPLKWSNRLEEYGLAKGYWILLTESDATSGFSYGARKLNSLQRKRHFTIATQKLHSNDQGKLLNEICGKHL